MRILNLGNGMRLGTGLAIGAAAVLLAPVILPVAAGVLKSLAKAGIKGGLILVEKGKVAVAEARESIEDLAAEARAEISEEQEILPVQPKKRAASTAAK